MASKTNPAASETIPATDTPSRGKRRDGIQPGNKTVLMSELKDRANEFFADETHSGDEVKGVVSFVTLILNLADQNSGFAMNFDDGLPTIAQPLRFL